MGEREALGCLQSQMGIRFENPGLLEQALTHSSLVNECPTLDIQDNQRLEFLGDAILDFLVGEWLYLRYPDAPEGELTNIRAYVVRTENLAALAQEIDLGSALRLGKGEAASGGQERTVNLCAVLEAVIGAMYLDQGIQVTRSYVHGILEQHGQDIDGQRRAKDAKSLLQEYAQGHYRQTPSYCITDERGPDHAKVFFAQVRIGSVVWGEGTGTSKQSAEQAAAEAALNAHSISGEAPCA